MSSRWTTRIEVASLVREDGDIERKQENGLAWNGAGAKCGGKTNPFKKGCTDKHFGLYLKGRAMNCTMLCGETGV